MKKQLSPYFGKVNGRERLLVSLLNFRKVYSTEIKKHPLLDTGNVYKYADGKTKSHGTPRAAWYQVLGISPVGTDGCKQRCAFLYDEIIPVLSALKWEADEEEVQETLLPSDNKQKEQADGGNADERDEIMPLDAFCALVLQIVNQKLDRIMNELGVDFKLDEKKLLQAIEG